MLIPPSDSNLSNQDKTTRTSPRAPWVLILPLALATGVLLQQSQNTDVPVQNAVQNATTNMVRNSVQTDSRLNGEPARYVLFVPNENGDLKKETVSDPSWRVSADDFAADSQKVRAQVAMRAVQTLMQRHANEFPASAQIEDASIDEDRTVLSFNRAFTDAAFWQGSARTLASVYALVNTAIESQKSVTGESGKDEVLFMIEDQPVQTLGELDTSEPLKPDMKMVSTR